MFSWQIVLSSLAVLIPALYLYYRAKFSHWSSRGVPGPPPSFPLGNMWSLFADQWPTVFKRWTDQFGPIFGIYEATLPTLVVNDASLAKEIMIQKFNCFNDRRPQAGHKVNQIILINRNGDDWRRCRAIMSPSFTAAKMKAMYPLMSECYEQLDTQLEKLSQSKEPAVVKELYSHLTSTVVSRCAFATKINPFTNANDPLVRHLKQMFKVGLRPLMMLLFPKWLLDLMQFTLPDRTALDYLNQLIGSIIRQRKDTKSLSTDGYTDLLQLMMDSKTTAKATASTTDHEAHHGVEDSLDTTNLSPEASLTEEEIAANASLFFAAGFETTSSLLTFSNYILAKHPDVQERLYQEVRKVDQECKGDLGYEMLTGIAYLDAFISEVLRLFPPLILSERVASQQVTLSTGLTIEKGTIIKIPIYNIHHNPEYFDEAEQFRAERFLPENRHQITPGTYLPFSIGPRNCIGMRFALMEVKLTLAKLILKYKLLPVQRLDVKPKFEPSPFLKFAEDLLIRFEKRNN